MRVVDKTFKLRREIAGRFVKRFDGEAGRLSRQSRHEYNSYFSN